MRRLKLKHQDPPIHARDIEGNYYTIYLEGTEPVTSKGKSAALDISLPELIALHDRIELLLEGQADD